MEIIKYSAISVSTVFIEKKDPQNVVTENIMCIGIILVGSSHEGSISPLKFGTACVAMQCEFADNENTLGIRGNWQCCSVSMAWELSERS